MWGKTAFTVLFVTLLAVAFPSSVDAQSYSGRWRASALRIRVNVESWGADCGPRPTNITIPGRAVRISHSGNKLTFHGTPNRTTDTCWTENRASRLRQAQPSENRWVIRCSTPQNDSRRERNTYTIAATDENTITYRETTNYQWQINESSCIARSTGSQSYRRIIPEGEPTAMMSEPEPAPAMVEPPEPRRCSGRRGAAARVRIRPQRAELPPGEQVCFRARLVDANGCAVRGAVRYTLQKPDHLSGEIEDNCFVAAANAAEAEGEFKLIASSGRLRAQVPITVKSIDLSDLIARRAATGGVGAFDEFGEAETEDEVGINAQAEEASSWPWWAAAALALLALLVGLALLFLLRRRKREHTEAVREAESRVPPPPKMGCPKCGKLYEPDTTFCEDDDAALVQEHELERFLHKGKMICPTCRRGYAAGTQTCENDGTPLVGYEQFSKRSSQAAKQQDKPKRCPKCGDEFPPGVGFCGKDGIPLVDIR